MTTIRTLLMVACALGLPAMATAAEPEGKTYILGVAVTNYDVAKSGFSPLDRAAADMPRILEHLKKGAKNPVVYFLAQPAGNSQYEPSSRNLRFVLNEFAKSVTARDRVIVYLIGHGFENKKGAVFCTSDCDLDNPKSMITVNEITARVKALPAHEKVVILECCRDFRDAIAVEEMLPSEDDSVTRPKLVGPPSTMIVVQSCSAGERACLKPDTGRAHMSARLLEALGGVADVNRDGQITVREAVAYLRKYVTDDARTLNRENQHVTMSEEGVVDSFALVPSDRVTGGVAASTPPPLSSATEKPIDARTVPLGHAGVPTPHANIRYGPSVTPNRPVVQAALNTAVTSGFNPNAVLRSMTPSIPNVRIPSIPNIPSIPSIRIPPIPSIRIPSIPGIRR